MTPYDRILLITTCAAIIAEVIAVLMPGRVIALVESTPEELPRGPLVMVMAILSLAYMVTVFLLIFSGDRVFTVYGAVLVVLSGSVWIARRWVRQFRILMTVDSSVCLIILIDVARTLVR